jgi:hypothetical protein
MQPAGSMQDLQFVLTGFVTLLRYRYAFGGGALRGLALVWHWGLGMVEYRVVRTWADRVRLVRGYLESPGRWPDGIDTKGDRWYLGREGYWWGVVGHLDERGEWAGGIDDEAAYKRFRVSDGVDGPLSAAERMRRYRERRKAGSAGGEGNGEAKSDV